MHFQDSGHKKSKSFHKITTIPTKKKGSFLKEELFLRVALLSFFHVYTSRESILAGVREAMTQPGFTSDGSFCPSFKVKVYMFKLHFHCIFFFFFACW